MLLQSDNQFFTNFWEFTSFSFKDKKLNTYQSSWFRLVSPKKNFVRLILGQTLRKSWECGKLKLNGLHRDHPLAWAISVPTSMGDKTA